MPSIFKNVIRSRRKKQKNKSRRNTAPVNFDAPASKPIDPDQASSSHHHQQQHCETKPLHHQIQFLRVSADGEKEGRQSLHDPPTNRQRSKSFEHTPDSSKDIGKKKLLKSLRRKSKPEPATPETVASSGSSSDHDRPPRHTRSKSFDEPPVPTSVKTRDTSKPIRKGTIRRVGDEKPISWKGTKTKLRFEPNENGHHNTTTKATKPEVGGGAKRSSSNTKTVIMNGDIVLSSSYNSKSTCETATITSTCSNSKQRAKRRETERNARAAAALDEKANELFEKGYFDKAMACYTKALKLKRRTFAHLLEETDDIEGALELRDEGGNPADPEALVSMATSINNIGYLRQRSGDATPEETMAAYKKSLRIKRRILGNDSLSVGKTLNNIGSVHYLKRDFEKALSAYHEALDIMKANLGDKHPDVATVMSNIGDVYLAQADKKTSVKYYRLALNIRWEAFGEHSPRTVRLLEKISNLEIGDMTMRMGGQFAGIDDQASEAMSGSAFQSISGALGLLQEQVKIDMQRLDQMERDAALENLKDKIILIRGMREIWNGSSVELLDNDSASVQTAMSRLSTSARQY